MSYGHTTECTWVTSRCTCGKYARQIRPLLWFAIIATIAFGTLDAAAVWGFLSEDVHTLKTWQAIGSLFVLSLIPVALWAGWIYLRRG